MARINERLSTRFVQQHDKSKLKFVIATLPLAGVLIWFVVSAYQRPSKPFYNLPSYMTDDYAIRKAADDTGPVVPLMDMTIVVLSFCVAWSSMAAYFLGFLGARQKLIDNYLANGTSILGNVVHETRCWAFEFRYYGYCSYPHPDPEEARNGAILHKKVRIFEPYTRELVPILILPGFPHSGQGKDDVEYANLVSMKERPREIFQGRLCLFWAIVCALVPIYFIHQMAVINEAEYYAGITDDYDNPKKGWKVYALFMIIGVGLFAIGGVVAAWFHRRWYLLHQGKISYDGDISLHGVEGGGESASRSGEDYVSMGR